MELYIFPTKKNPTEQDLRDFRQIILDSLSDANTWELLDRKIDIGKNVKLPLFTHTEKHYQNEPFYFRWRDESLIVKFEKDKDEGSKSMIIGMLVYYLCYNLSDGIGKIEIK